MTAHKGISTTVRQTHLPNVLIEGAPATAIMGATGHNCMAKLMNGPGTTLAPSQTFVMGS